MNGPFGGPRPFAGASMNVRFTFSQNIEKTDVEIEQRLRRNGFTRADVEMEPSKADSRTQIRVVTGEELFAYSQVRRLVEQVKAEVSQDIPDSRIDVFCT
jgi:hypothetical protein